MTPIHLGRKTPIWYLEIINEANQAICVSRLTMMVRKIRIF
ncbi:MAG: Unknown protein [uncultured Aureispira sp.]|uniref:Uncharacterized protein n=1 Tax=uncultured Aureispira sp. TaxID=1331704 RepID=A0A6S6TX04_9BACT|nr:MAG: Unknown protein [uncultured Aureispira sp.]